MLKNVTMPCSQVFRAGDKRLREFVNNAEDDDAQYEVDEIVHQRTVDRQIELRIKWKVSVLLAFCLMQCLALHAAAHWSDYMGCSANVVLQVFLGLSEQKWKSPWKHVHSCTRAELASQMQCCAAGVRT